MTKTLWHASSDRATTATAKGHRVRSTRRRAGAAIALCAGTLTVLAGVGASTAEASTTSHQPRGSVDSVVLDQAGIAVTGWSFDPDAPGRSIPVVVSDDSSAGHRQYAVTANLPRPDVNGTYGLPGRHGFNLRIPTLVGGRHHMCFRYANVGAGSDVSGGCTTIDAPMPRGSLDYAFSRYPGVVHVSGWGLDGSSPSLRQLVTISVSGPGTQLSTDLHTGQLVPSVNATYAVNGNHGFSINLPYAGHGPTTVCATVHGAHRLEDFTQTNCKSFTIGNGGSTPTPPTPTPPAPPAPATWQYDPTLAQQTADAVNAYRAARGLYPFKVTIAPNTCVITNYGGCGALEAQGYSTAAATVAAWDASPGHRAALVVDHLFTAMTCGAYMKSDSSDYATVCNLATS